VRLQDSVAPRLYVASNVQRLNGPSDQVRGIKEDMIYDHGKAVILIGGSAGFYILFALGAIPHRSRKPSTRTRVNVCSFNQRVVTVFLFLKQMESRILDLDRLVFVLPGLCGIPTYPDRPGSGASADCGFFDGLPI
jgi:hypothetical protein